MNMPSSQSRHSCLVWLVAALCASSQAIAAPRSPLDVRRAQTRFESTAAGYRQIVGRLPGVSTAEREVMGDVRFVYERSSLPRAQALNMFGERKVVLSDGWMAMVEEAVLAGVATARTDEPMCFSTYIAIAVQSVRNNRRQGNGSGSPAPYAMPRFADFVGLTSNCSGVKGADLRSRAVEDATAIGVDSALVWQIGRLVALHTRDIAVASSPVVVTSGPVEANNTGCAIDAANRRSIERAAKLHIDLLPAHAAILAHELLFAVEPGEANEGGCEQARRRVDSLFESLKPAHATAVGAKELEAARSRVASAWNSMSR